MMKGSSPRITLLGNNSGRNLGDAAIMSAILDVLSKELPTAEFYVPSIAPQFIDDHYGEQYNVKGINVMPWTGSLRLLGIPTMRCIAKSDIALICDGIIFGKNLWNPAFNFLITLIFLVPWAKLTGCKVVCYSCGIGPFPSFWSRLFARWVINGSDLVIMRENDSKALAEEIGVTKPIEVTGDAAFLNPVSSPERAIEICKEEGISLDRPILGINVTKYIDSWLKPEERISDKSVFLSELAEGLRLFASDEKDPVQFVLFCTQPMDEPFTYELASQIDAKVVHNSKYLSHDIQSVMQRCELLIGMRFHSLVLASAVEAPIVGLIYAPKVRGFMRLLDCEEFGLELGTLSPSILSQTLTKAWNNRQELKR
ncbi:MAG: polysaccharide pyruvyl transferase family protein, partial [Bdellovibrionales bacterium]|nr:polysaccharide pyruvyl transferase family protein [Bdellovibrionales bacterium]